jgi:hypothetical protein
MLDACYSPARKEELYVFRNKPDKFMQAPYCAVYLFAKKKLLE